MLINAGISVQIYVLAADQLHGPGVNSNYELCLFLIVVWQSSGEAAMGGRKTVKKRVVPSPPQVPDAAMNTDF